MVAQLGSGGSAVDLVAQLESCGSVGVVNCLVGMWPAVAQGD